MDGPAVIGPRIRVGDAERDEAVRLLGEHLAAGRIDYDEFEERMSTALQSRHQGELLALFADLPGRKPTIGTDAPSAPPQPSAGESPAKRSATRVGVRALGPALLLALPMLMVLSLVVLPGHIVLFGPLLFFLLLGRGGFVAQPVRHTPPGQQHRPSGWR